MPKRSSLISPTMKRSFSATFGYLALELLIVFIGVFAAFQLSRYQQERELELRRQQLIDALRREIEAVIVNTSRTAENLPAMIDQLESAIENGDRPTLTPILEAVRVRAHMWELAMRGNTLDVLDVPTLYSLSRFYSSLDTGLEQMQQLRSLSESVLLPNLDKPKSEFYDENGRLRQKYQWYLTGMKTLQNEAESITELGRELLNELGGDAPTDG